MKNKYKHFSNGSTSISVKRYGERVSVSIDPIDFPVPVTGVFIGHFWTYVDGKLIRLIGISVVENKTDKQLLDQFIPLGHKEENVREVITYVRKKLNKPNPTSPIVM